MVMVVVSTAHYTMFPECKEAYRNCRENEYENESTGMKLAHKYTNT